MSTATDQPVIRTPLVRFEVELIRDIRIPTTDPNVTRSGDLYLPMEAHPVPALVTVVPYRKDASAGIGAAADLHWFAERGYTSLLVDFRGTGSSDGTQRPPLDPGEADDAIAAIEWAATQRWCDGNVGMWGSSYGAIMSLRTASLRPAHRKAIVPVVGMLHPERDFVHPDGTRGGLSFASWGATNLAFQLLPPLHNHHSIAEQRRWRQRLHDTEPWIVDLFRHGPGDPVWRERVIDASAITVPTLCVGGWRDLFCEGTVRAYEQIPAPKKLVMGPWMHNTKPPNPPFEQIDILALAARWWDRWLRGIDNGVTDEPPVTLYVQGSTPGWQAYDSWPPANDEFVLATEVDTTLATPESVGGEWAGVIGEYEPDPTTGPLSGLWGIPTTGFGLPLDQHYDDRRALSATSEPLPDDLLIAGRPEVTVRLAVDGRSPDASVKRIIVRLAEVDPQGRSTFITAGVVCPTDSREAHRVVLRPTAYRVAAGLWLRVVLSDADFPRLWPVEGATPLHVAGIELVAPTLPAHESTSVDLPSLEEPTSDAVGLGLWEEPLWQITRDAVHDSVEVIVGHAAAAYTPNREHLFELHRDTRATVRRDEPEAPVMEATSTAVTRMSTGEIFEIRATARLTNAALWARGEVRLDDTTIFSRTWEA